MPPYIKDPRGGVRPALEEAHRRSPTPTGSRTPLPFLVQLGEVEGEKEKGGRRPSLLVQFGLGGEGARGLLWKPLPLLHIRPIRPINPPGGSGNPPVLRFYPILFRNPSGVRI